MALPKLTIGRLVRYVLSADDLPDGKKEHAGTIIPAMVVSTGEGWLEATLSGFSDFKTLGTLPILSLPNRVADSEKAPGTWHWPPEFLTTSTPLREKAPKEAKKVPVAGPDANS